MVTDYLQGIKLTTGKVEESEQKQKKYERAQRKSLAESMKSNTYEKQMLLYVCIFRIDKTHPKTSDAKLGVR